MIYVPLALLNTTGSLAEIRVEILGISWEPEREFPGKLGIGPSFPAARVSASFRWLQGPAVTDIKDAQLRDRFNLDALREPAMTDIAAVRS